MLLSIIIVSYNTKQLTLQTIESAQQEINNSTLLKKQTEIIVVDNNSSDGSITALKKMASVKVLVNQENSGFAKANNQAISIAQGKYVMLLNSDTIVKTNALENLIKTLETYQPNDTTSALSYEDKVTDRLGILAASLLNPDGTPQPQGGSLPSLFTLANHMLMFDDLPLIGKYLPSTQETGRRFNPQRQHKLIKKDWVGGTAVVIRKELIQEVGVLDENIFMYGEDIEFCLRAKAHHWDVAELPSAKIIHFGSASSTSANAIRGELSSYLYIWSKHYPSWQKPIARLIIKIGCYLRWLVFGTMKRNSIKVKIYQELLRTI